jgi:predicted Zn-dependent protease
MGVSIGVDTLFEAGLMILVRRFASIYPKIHPFAGMRGMLAIALMLFQLLANAATGQERSLAADQAEIDGLLGKADSVELGKLSPRVLDLADRLLREKGDAVALPYFEKGLEGNSWALDRQLTLGEILARNGQPDALREKAEMVLRLAEEDEVLARAERLLDHAQPEMPGPLGSIKVRERLLILVPINGVSLFALRDLRDTLSKRLGIKVVLASVEMKIPNPHRSMKTQWVTRTRDQVIGAITAQPALAGQVEKLGFSVEKLRTDDQALEAFVRKTTEMEQGAAAAQALDSMLAEFEASKQWDIEQLMPAFEVAVGKSLGPQRLVLGITDCDLFGGASNFLFGAAQTGNFLGLISTHRFRAIFNDEAPKRERFNERVLKQSLATIGFMLGVPRCNTPECARAYPRSLQEHDQKPSRLCPACHAGFEERLGQKLPED